MPRPYAGSSVVRRPPDLGAVLAVWVVSTTAIAGLGMAVSTGPATANGRSPGGVASSGVSTLLPPTPASGPFVLSSSVSPSAICASASNSCPVGTGVARVTLQAVVQNPTPRTWSAVQLLFVLETTPYDGAYDPSTAGGDPGFDACGAPPFSGRHLCEEANAVAFFAANAGVVAAGIQRANPNTAVSFGLVDFAPTGTSPWDDSDASTFHVDVGTFTAAAQFGTAVRSSFQATVLGGGTTVPDSDLHDNFLDSSSITALFGGLNDPSIGWSNAAHHVLVMIGSTAPRDPQYIEDYCVSPHAFSTAYSGSDCLSASCEPAHSFGAIASPACLGWTLSHDGIPADSVAGQARSASSCTGSLGRTCTIDVVDLATTPTDPNSAGWPNRTSTIADDRSIVVQNVAHVVLAGCDLASATGGSWDGPFGATCPDGATGSLPFPSGSASGGGSGSSNPGLESTLARVAFGAPAPPGNGLDSIGPTFRFLPFGAVEVLADGRAVASCLHNASPWPGCSAVPTSIRSSEHSGLEWNWSTTPSGPAMASGDVWTASFDIVAGGPPYGTVPVDACITPDCLAGGSGPVEGAFTSASWANSSTAPSTQFSFPLATVRVESPAAPSAPPSPPVPPPGGGPPSVLAPPALFPGGQTAATGPSISIANLSVQAIAAGALAAGFTRVALKARAPAIRMAVRSGATPARSPRRTPREE